jgi:chromate transporter
MIYLRLFLTFLKIGLVSFGGGYGMISMTRDDCLANGWLTEEELLNFIAVAESTPGPIAVNMATFVGSSQGGFLGALLATLGVVTPSFLIILLIASLFTRLMKYGAVRAGLSGIRPAIVSLILATGANMLLNLLFGINSALATPILEWRGILIFLVIIAASLGYDKWKSKKISPILLIILSGILGMILY